MTSTTFREGGYRFIPGVFQYSAGVAAEPSFRIERVRFQKPVPLADGFRRIEALIRDAGRPLTSFCACELRSPEPFSEAGFRAFNQAYVGELARWGLIEGETNPVARSNVCPEIGAPAEPAFHAFAFTVPASDAPPSFCIAGSGEAPEGKATYRDHIVRLGDRSPDGLRVKAEFVLAEMERRLQALGVAWADTTASQVYTVFDFFPLIADQLVACGAAAHGVTWHYDRPPVEGIDFEMDCRGVHLERVV